ncbi:hypothetical protein KCU81_g112, partial [Aureobasidium melanogenum]
MTIMNCNVLLQALRPRSSKILSRNSSSVTAFSPPAIVLSCKFVQCRHTTQFCVAARRWRTKLDGLVNSIHFIKWISCWAHSWLDGGNMLRVVDESVVISS